MRIWISILIAVGSLFGEERIVATGQVMDADGKLVQHATVMVYSAGAKKGYSIFCPTCYRDCGKRTLTDEGGKFAIAGLSPDLLFTLLVVKDGYSAAYIEKLDPAKDPGQATLKPRSPVEDVSQLVRGKVVDGHGMPLRDAMVQQQGVVYNGPRGMGRAFGSFGWIDQVVVTNDQGEFEIAYGKPAVQLILEVAARGMAPKLFTEPTGADRKIMTVTDGAVIRGRLMYNGEPVANAELGLTTHGRSAGTSYPEVRIGTRDDGTFAITNVPAGRIWLTYPTMESLASRGIGGDAVPCETQDDGQEVDLGDIQLKPAYTIRGQVLLSDGKPMPPDMHVTLGADRRDTQIVPIGPDGRFEAHGLPAGIYEVIPAVKGYRTAESFSGEALVNRDVNNFIIRVEPK